MSTGAIERMLEKGFMRPGEINNPLVIGLRMLAIPIVILSVRTRLHPNFITAISLILGCLAALFYYIGADHAFIVAWFISVILDYADGTIARKLSKESHFGYLFDMLGDRLKLVLLVIAWCLVEEEIFCYLVAGLILTLLLAIEIVTHLFVRNRQNVPENETVNATLKEKLKQIFLEFHMHSFLIYGMALYFGGVVGVLAGVWLSLIMILKLEREIDERIIHDGKISVILNPRIANKHISKWFSINGER